MQGGKNNFEKAKRLFCGCNLNISKDETFTETKIQGAGLYYR